MPLELLALTLGNAFGESPLPMLRPTLLLIVVAGDDSRHSGFRNHSSSKRDGGPANATRLVVQKHVRRRVCPFRARLRCNPSDSSAAIDSFQLPGLQMRLFREEKNHFEYRSSTSAISSSDARTWRAVVVWPDLSWTHPLGRLLCLSTFPRPVCTFPPNLSLNGFSLQKLSSRIRQRRRTTLCVQLATGRRDQQSDYDYRKFDGGNSP